MEEEERGRKGLFRVVGEVRKKQKDERILKRSDSKEKIWERQGRSRGAVGMEKRLTS